MQAPNDVGIKVSRDNKECTNNNLFTAKECSLMDA